MKSITEWIQESAAVAHEKGFNAAEDIHRSLMLTVGEIAEAQNELRQGHFPQETYWESAKEGLGFVKPEGFGIKLADAVLRIFNLAADLGIDLETLITLKHEYNKSRPPMHGGKKF